MPSETKDPPPLRCVQVGLGEWGENWCRVVLPYLRRRGIAEPVAIVDVDESRFSLAQETLGLPSSCCYTSLKRALADNDCDFVIVVVPPVAHEEVIGTALEQRRHVLCEKPLADSLPGCLRISEQVSNAGVKMAVTMSHRFDQDKQSLQSAVESGKYGPLNYLVYRFTGNYRAFGSWGEFRHRIADPLLVEGSVHHFDIIRAIAASDAKTVYAKTWNPAWGEYAGDSTALIIIEMLNGVRCLYEGAKANASTMNGWGQDYIRAECEYGTLELNHRKLTVLKSGPGGKDLTRERLGLRRDRPKWLNSAIAEDFCDWLRGGPPPPTNYVDNLQCCALLFGAIEAAHTGRCIDVQAFLAEAAMSPT